MQKTVRNEALVVGACKLLGGVHASSYRVLYPSLNYDEMNREEDRVVSCPLNPEIERITRESKSCVVHDV